MTGCPTSARVVNDNSLYPTSNYTSNGAAVMLDALQDDLRLLLHQILRGVTDSFNIVPAVITLYKYARLLNA